MPCAAAAGRQGRRARHERRAAPTPRSALIPASPHGSACRSTSTSRALIDVYGRETDRPHLAVSLGEVSVSIGPAPGQAGAEDARFARELAEQAAEYAAEVERLCAGTRARRTWSRSGMKQGGAAGTRKFLPPLVSPSGLSQHGEVFIVVRNVTGEQLAQVDNPDPFASPVWRSPVYRTPECVIWLVQLVRLPARVIWFLVRHPLLDCGGGAGGLAWCGWAGPAWWSWRPSTLTVAERAAGLAGRTGSPGWSPARRGAGGGGGSTGGAGTPS